MTMLYFWLSLAAILLVAEMLSGTFYLMLLSLGAFLGALIAYFEIAIAWQIVAVAIFSAATIIALRPWNKKKSTNLNLDTGEVIHIEEWSERRARAKYRGALWDIKLDEQLSLTAAKSGNFIIVSQHGNTLIVAPESK